MSSHRALIVYASAWLAALALAQDSSPAPAPSSTNRTAEPLMRAGLLRTTDRLSANTSWRSAPRGPATNALRATNGPLAEAARARQARAAAQQREVGARDLHTTVHRITSLRTNAATGRVASRVSHLVEMADGLNWQDETGQWRTTQVAFWETPEAFVARFGPHKVILNRQMGAGVADIETPDHIRLVGAPLCLTYFDPVSGQSLTLAEAQPSAGRLLNSNAVVYSDVFLSPRASVRYTYLRNGLHQDILLHEAPPDPSRFGFSDRTRLEVITEWEPDIAEPVKSVRVLAGETNAALRAGMAEPDLVDETLAFGQEMTMAQGVAFALNVGPAESEQVPVAKRFLRIGHRPVLIESVEHRILKPWLDALPAARLGHSAPAGPGTTLAAVVEGRRLPQPWGSRPAMSNGSPSEEGGRTLASTEPSVVLDFVFQLSGTKTSWLFASSTNYWIVGWTSLGGVTTIEGGTVIKYKQGVGAELVLNGIGASVVCKTSQYFPAVLTADRDDSVGEFLYPNDPEVDPRGQYYAQTALQVNTYGTYLRHLRICYAQQAIRYGDVGIYNQASHSLRNVQIGYCDRGVTAYGNASYGRNITVGNALFFNTQKPISGYYASFTLEQATVDGAARLTTADGSALSVNMKNSICANVPDRGSGSVSGSYNGFHNVPTVQQFGSPKFISDPNPFQTVAQGSHYLLPESSFRQKGTTGIGATTLTDLKKRTTQAPIVMAFPMMIEMDTIWFPQVPRYVSGAPDLGYAYDPLDYLIANLYMENATLWIAAGTAVGVWPTIQYDYSGHPCLWGVGLHVGTGSLLISQGTPLKMNRLVTSDLVQEGWNPEACSVIYSPLDCGDGDDCGGLTMLAADGADPYPEIRARFTEFSCLTDFRRCHLATGWDAFGGAYAWNYGSFSGLDFQDCQFRSGVLNLNQYYAEGVGPVRFHNNLLERVLTWISPELANTLTACNNTFKGGVLCLFAPADPPDWTFTDNLFDRTDIGQGVDMVNDYNGYYLDAGQYRLSPNGTHDKILTASPVYYTSTLGSYYLPTSGLLYNGGSRTPGEAGLYHHTTRTDQKKDGEETETPNKVNIGFHYAALVSGLPKDTESDGLPDYFEDKNGNNTLDTDETSLTLSDTDGDGFPDPKAAVFDEVDLDSDGLVGRIEKALNLNPLTPESPLTLTRIVTGQEPDIATFLVPLSYDQLATVGSVHLWADGESVPLQSCERNADGKTRLIWNTTFDPPGQHNLCARLSTVNISRDNGPDLTTRTAAGSVLPFTVNNVLQFDPFYGEFDSNGAWLYAKLPEWDAEYNIQVRSPSGILVKTVTGTTSNGKIKEAWNLTGDNGVPYTGDSLEATFNVSLPGSGTSGTHRFRLYSTAVYLLEGDFTVCYAWDNPQLAQGAMREAIQWGVVDTLLKPTSVGGYSDNPYGSTYNAYSCFGCTPNPGYLPDQSYAWPLLCNLDAVTTRNFHFDGHGNDMTIGDNNETVEQTVSIGWVNIEGALENHFDPLYGVRRGHPYRLVFLNACDTADNSNYAHAFGVYDYIEPSQLADRPDAVQAFVGWIGEPRAPDSAAEWYQMCTTYGVFYGAWMNGFTLRQCIDMASSRKPFGEGSDITLDFPLGLKFTRLQGYYSPYPNNFALKVRGYPGIKRTGFE